VEIRWKCAPEKLKNSPDTPEQAVFHFPGGLADYLAETLGTKATVTETIFSGKSKKDSGHGRVEWAISWSPEGYGEADSFVRSYCNTVPTPGGGTHEAGLRAAITKGLRAYADLTGMGKKVSHVTPDDVMFGAGALVSVFIKSPEFQGQTKDRLSNSEASRLVETAVRDPFDHFHAKAARTQKSLSLRAIQQAAPPNKRVHVKHKLFFRSKVRF